MGVGAGSHLGQVRHDDHLRMAGELLQALGNGLYSLAISFGRPLVVLLPAAYLLSRPGEVDYVWLAFPIAELVSVALNIFFMKRINQQVLSGLDPA